MSSIISFIVLIPWFAVFNSSVWFVIVLLISSIFFSVELSLIIGIKAIPIDNNAMNIDINDTVLVLLIDSIFNLLSKYFFDLWD